MNWAYQISFYVMFIWLCDDVRQRIILIECFPPFFSSSCDVNLIILNWEANSLLREKKGAKTFKWSHREKVNNWCNGGRDEMEALEANLLIPATNPLASGKLFYCYFNSSKNFFLGFERFSFKCRLLDMQFSLLENEGKVTRGLFS